MCVDTSNRYITKEWFKNKLKRHCPVCAKNLVCKSDLYTHIDKIHGSSETIKLSGEFKGENLKLFKHGFPYTTNYEVHEEFKVETVKESNLDPLQR